MNQRSILLIIVVIAIIGSIAYLQSQKVMAPENASPAATITPVSHEEKAKKYAVAKDISTPDGFINTDSISIADLIGKKVILVDFWTYSCINCQRTTPYLNAWYDKYKDQGLEIIGVHTPEFEFEKVYDNVKQAVAKEGIKFPVVLDNDYSTWQAYGNRYWPRKYLIDIDGYIVYDHIGEGSYDETEQKIQAALQERVQRLGESIAVDNNLVIPNGDVAVPSGKPTSRETYFGSARNDNLVTGKPHSNGVQTINEIECYGYGNLCLQGQWNFTDEYAETKKSSTILYNYQATNVYFVGSADHEMLVEVLLDDKPLGDRAGKDIIIKDGKSYLMIQSNRLYEIVHDTEYGQHSLKLLIPEAGLQAFTFTFG